MLGVQDREGRLGWGLFFLDSGDYPKTPEEAAWSGSTYDWIRAEQGAWLKAAAAAEELRGVPKIAFHHIPLFEHRAAAAACEAGAWADPGCVGVKQEDVCSPDVNGGAAVALAEAGIAASFVGHDHTNDFCSPWDGLALCFGGGTGYHGYGKAGWARRARVLELGSGGGLRTWKVVDTGAGGPHRTIDEQVLIA